MWQHEPIIPALKKRKGQKGQEFKASLRPALNLEQPMSKKKERRKGRKREERKDKRKNPKQQQQNNKIKNKKQRPTKPNRKKKVLASLQTSRGSSVAGLLSQHPEDKQVK